MSDLQQTPETPLTFELEQMAGLIEAMGFMGTREEFMGSTDDEHELLREILLNQIRVDAPAVANFLYTQKMRISSIETMELDLRKRKQDVQNRVKLLSATILDVLKHADLKKVEAGAFTLMRVRSAPVVEIENEEEIPKEFQRHIPEAWQVDKKKIAEAFKASVPVPGASLRENHYLKLGT